MTHITVRDISSAMIALEGKSSPPLDVEKTSRGKRSKVGSQVKRKRFPEQGIMCVEDPEQRQQGAITEVKTETPKSWKEGSKGRDCSTLPLAQGLAQVIRDCQQRYPELTSPFFSTFYIKPPSIYNFIPLTCGSIICFQFISSFKPEDGSYLFCSPTAQPNVRVQQ